MPEVEIMTMRKRMLAGLPFRPDDSSLRADVEATAERLAAFNAAPASERPQRLAELVASVGEGADVRTPLYVEFGERVFLGARFKAGPGLVVQDHAEVIVGDGVQVGAHVQLLTLTLPVQAGPRADGWAAASSVSIGDNVQLGAGVVVTPGARIGDHTVVGPGSVVIGNLPANVVAVGNPAKPIGRTTS